MRTITKCQMQAHQCNDFIQIMHHVSDSCRQRFRGTYDRYLSSQDLVLRMAP